MMNRPPRAQSGVTLVELVIVIVLSAIIAAALSAYIKPSMDAFTDVRVRADLVDQADTALRRMTRDIRRAVPNSLRVPSNQCFELVPSVAGGRYRAGPDSAADTLGACPVTQPTPPTAPSASCSAWVDTTQETMAFDVLSPLPPTVSDTDLSGSYIVINNQNGNDVYAGTNRSTISAVTTPASPPSALGYKRLTFGALQVSPGYTGGRFQVVHKNEASVFYYCVGTNPSATTGDGEGTLYRRVSTSFSASYPTCPSSGAGATIIARRVRSCSFIYDPNSGGTQQSGYMLMNVELMRNSEISRLVIGAHVMNVP
jgi:MSHA biogenesis protein MshO